MEYMVNGRIRSVKNQGSNSSNDSRVCQLIDKNEGGIIFVTVMCFACVCRSMVIDNIQNILKW